MFMWSVDEYLDEYDLDYDDVILRTIDGKIVEPSPLIAKCYVLNVNGNELLIR